MPTTRGNFRLGIDLYSEFNDLVLVPRVRQETVGTCSLPKYLQNSFNDGEKRYGEYKFLISFSETGCREWSFYKCFTSGYIPL